MKYLIALVIAIFCISAGLFVQRNWTDIIDALITNAEITTDEVLSTALDGALKMCREPDVKIGVGADETACEKKIRANDSLCKSEAYRKWPRKLNSYGEAQEIGRFYGECLVTQNAQSSS